MFEKIDNKTSNYQSIVEQIKKMIISGRLKCGDKLPSERELSNLFGVSRASIREAIKALEVMGILESRQGEGNFIVNNLNQTTCDNILLIYNLNNGTVKDIMQLRKCIEMESVVNIINNCTDAEINEIKEIVNRFNTATDFSSQYVADIQFHTKIILLSRNVLFQYLGEALSCLIKSNIKIISDIIHKHYPKDELYRNHNDIMNAIEARDIAAARIAIHRHYTLSNEEEVLAEKALLEKQFY